MLQELTIVHRRKPGVFLATENDADWVWATCLRSLAFVTGTPDFKIEAGDEIYSQREAYQFLLEIVCGLHSPIVGETEVFGQFKAFAAGWAAREPRVATLVQRVLNDAKSIRSQFLNGLGNQSYGSWLRKNLDQTEAHLLGAGQLAGEILPYLQKQSAVTIHARRPGHVRLDAPVVAVAERGFGRGTLVIAASMSASEIRAWLGAKIPAQIFDLRDDSAADPVYPHAVSLTQIFGQIERTRVRLLPVVEHAKTEIANRSRAAAAQEKVRPQGWDDLCA